MDRAIEQIGRLVLPQSIPPPGHSLPPLTPLTQVLLGIIKPSPSILDENIQFLDASLNPSQKDAVRFALESAEIALIHGPPGVSANRLPWAVNTQRSLTDRKDTHSRRNHPSTHRARETDTCLWGK